LKLKGMLQAASHHRPDLIRAQRIAETIGAGGQVITSDDVREKFLDNFERELNIGCAMGSLFDPNKWEKVGMVKSKRVSAHCRYIGQWRLKLPCRNQL
jgi:hypothetical protein